MMHSLKSKLEWTRSQSCEMSYFPREKCLAYYFDRHRQSILGSGQIHFLLGT